MKVHICDFGEETQDSAGIEIATDKGGEGILVVVGDSWWPWGSLLMARLA